MIEELFTFILDGVLRFLWFFVCLGFIAVIILVVIILITPNWKKAENKKSFEQIEEDDYE